MRNTAFYIKVQRILLLLIALLSHSLIMYSHESPKLRYETITMAQGLPTLDSYYVYQDKEGFVWFGTSNGLCRWDGYQVQSFKSDYRTPDLLIHNWINCIAEDADHNLWIGSQFGLNVLDKKTGKTKHFSKSSLSNQTVCAILVTKENDIYIGTNWGLNKYNPETDTFTHYFSNPTENSVCGNDIKALIEDSKGYIWIGTWDQGICRYDKKNGTFYHFPKINERNSAYYLFEDSQKNIWVGSWECGLTRIVNPYDSNHCEYFTYEADRGAHSLSHNTVYCISQDSKYGYIWIGTPQGLNILTDINDKQSFLRYDTQSKREISDVELNYIYKDNIGGMWLAFNGSGIKKIDLSPILVQSYPVSSVSFINNYSISSIFEYPDDIFWLGTKMEGFVKYNRKTDRFVDFQKKTFGEQLGREMKTISSFSKFDNDDKIWGTSYYSGIYVFNAESELLQHLCTANTPRLVSDNISTLFLDKDQNLWIGSRGLNVFNDVDSLTVYHIDDESTYNKIGIQTSNRTSILSIIQDNTGKIWLGTENNGIYSATIYKNDLSSIRFKPYNQENGKINSNNIQHIYQDSNGVLWVGTKGGGLNMYNVEEDAFEMIHNSGDLLGDIIFNILEDNLNNLWLSTNKGIVRYNTHFPVEYQIRYFTSPDGIGDIVFNRGAYFKNRHGEMFFGGINGFCSFDPQKMTDNNFIPPVVITDIRIFNKSINDLPENERMKISREQPNYTESITLTHKQYNFQISFSALSFSNAEKNKYAYKLEGVDKEWQYADANHRYVNYSNLSPGNYIFKVKAANESGIWNEQSKVLKIEILPVFYQTWWARIVYILIIVGLGHISYIIISNRMSMKNALKIQKMEHTKMDELNQSKLRFFTNVSHELLTPLTVLSCGIVQLKENKPQNFERTLDAMQHNINRLIRLLQQILEFRKAESGNLKLKVSYGDIGNFIISICRNYFTSLSESKNIHIQTELFPDIINGWFDSDKIDKIIYNLISNAYKYNFEGGNISIFIQGLNQIEKNDYEQIIFKISNTGEGIAPENIPHLFKRFYEGDYRRFHTKGTGIGLSLTRDLVHLHNGEIQVKSVKNKYTEFTVTIPLMKEKYSMNQITEKDAIPMSMPEGKSLYEPMGDNIEYNSKDNSRPTLLIIEDDRDLLNILQDTFMSDYNILEAVDGEEGLKLAMENIPDIIISDIMMPGKDGYEVCHYLKNNINSSHIPIILLTAQIDKDSKLEGFEAGADLYISKPFEVDILKAQMKSLLENRKRLAKRFQGHAKIKELTSGFTSLDEHFLNKAIKLIEDNLSNPDFNLTIFQDEMHVTSSMLYRKFKVLTDFAPLEFLRKMRMEAALEILKQKKGNMSISEVAYAVGYNDPKYFSNSFKKVYGVLPSEFVKF